jgi:transposase-like protein
MARRDHDPVLRRRAIDLLESGKSVREVAEELGVSGQSIYVWRRQYRIDSGQEPGLTTTEVNELNAARRQIKHLEADLAVHELATELLKGSTNPKAGGRPSQ